MSVLVQARVDPKVKEDAAAVLEDMGLSISDAVRLMLVKTAKERTLPFEIWRPNAETIEAIEELRAGKGKAFSSISELMADLNDESED